MRLVQIAAILLLSASVYQNAMALTVDESTGTTANGAAKFGDPDDKIPYPHVSDDGQPSNNFQSQQIGNSGASFSLTPSSGNNPGAFERAQQRMQQ